MYKCDQLPEIVSVKKLSIQIRLVVMITVIRFGNNPKSKDRCSRFLIDF